MEQILQNVLWHDFENRLRSSKSLEDVQAICAELTELLGFDYYSYCLRAPLSLTKPLMLIVSDFPDGWINAYIDNRLFDVDPILHWAEEHMCPYTWAECGMAEVDPEILVAAASHGVADGLSCPQHGLDHELAVFNLVRATPVDAKSPEIQLQKIILKWFVGVLFEKSTELFPEAFSKSRDNTLTEREKDCLRWAAEGKTSWEIGQIMEIAESTVVHHLRNAGLKLGVSRRQGAVTKALAAGALEYSWQAAAEKNLNVIRATRAI